MGENLQGWRRAHPHCADGTQAVVSDPASNKVVGRFTTGDPVFGFDAISVWTTGVPGDRLMRVNPTTLKTTATLDVSLFDIAPGGGYEWVAEADDAGNYNGSIAKVDPRRTRSSPRFRRRRSPTRKWCFSTTRFG
jgi:hypothetical protein